VSPASILFDRQLTPAQMVARAQCRNNLLGAQLLLPMWQPGGHPGSRRRAEVHVPAIRPGTAGGRATCIEASTRLRRSTSIISVLSLTPYPVLVDMVCKSPKFPYTPHDIPRLPSRPDQD
jgi:hypothetical protein